MSSRAYRLRRTLAAPIAIILAATLAFPVSIAMAIPYEVSNLASSTHPTATTWYADDSPQFAWESDPVPEVIGSGDTSGRAYGVDVAGDHAYIADGLAGLTVVDISDLSTPSELISADTSGTAWTVDVCGDYAYVAGRDGGLHVVDVSEPGTPTVIGWTDTPDQAWGVTVEGSYAYVADDSAVQVVDVSDPTSPTIVGSHATAGLAYDTDVAGDVLYVGQRSGGLGTYDISDPTSPTPLGNSGSSANTIFVEGGNVFVERGQFIDVVDVTDPSSPSVVGSVGLDTGGLGSFDANDIAVSGDYAYVACDGGGPITDRDFQLLDVSDVTDPVVIGTVDVSSNTYGVAAFDGYALLANDWDGLAVVEVSELGTPRRVGTFDTGGVAYAVDVQGDLAYIADFGRRLTIADISDPTAPTLVGTLNQNWAIHDIAVSGGVAYGAGSGGGLAVFDVTDPTAPAVLTSADTTGTARGVDVQGDIAYVADGAEGLQVFDITTPSSPVYLGGVATSYANKVDVCGAYAYVADDDALTVIDISEPGTPTIVASGFVSYAEDVTVVGDTVYVVGYASVYSLDVSDPTDPTDLDSIVTLDGTLNGVDVAGDLLFAAAQDGLSDSDDPGALYVIDITDPSNLALLETVGTRRHAYDVAVAGDVAYVCNDRYVGNPNPWADSGLDVVSWGGPIGYSYVLDASDATLPDGSVDSTSPMASLTGVADGEWWFTVQAISRSGDVGPVQQRMVRIDTVTTTERLWGSDRYATAVALSKEAFPSSGSAGDIVVASGAGFADALSASGLAGALSAPIVLVPAAGTVPAAVTNEISRLAASDATVWVVGGTSAVSGGVASQLAVGDVGTVNRIDGRDRYETAAAVAAKIKQVQGSGFEGIAFVASGTNFPDALAASPIAYAKGFPVLLTNPAELSAATRGALSGVSSAVILGGTGAVSGITESQIDALPGTSVERWWGPGRYETAVDIAAEAEAKGWADAQYVGIASGENYPDALAGGPVAGNEGGVMLLVQKMKLPSATNSFLSANESRIETVQAYGGVGAIDSSVLTEIDKALE